MPAFQAINLDPEENVDELIDTTKELQVDEALKRFQNALKLQAQGVRSREAAGVAYTELFESEIFKYREARTDYERVEVQTSGQPEVVAPGISSEGLDVGAGGADGVAANLSLALYLSYKNYGLYFLDKLKDAFESDPAWHDKRRVCYDRDGGDKILNNWTAALDQDPSDPELWRKAARLAAAMNSGRLKRYCLEAAIELDDDPAVEEVEPPSLAESLAGEQLKDFLQHIGDNLALSHPVMLPWLNKSMPVLIKRHLDPFPFLPDPTLSLTSIDLTTNGELPMDDDDTLSIEPPGKPIASWTDLGRELIKCADDASGALHACECLLRTELPAEEVGEVERGAKSPRHASPLDVDKPSEPEKHLVGRKPLVTSRPEAKEGATGEAPVLSARKRSQSAAGLPEALEEETVAEKRSKRVRRRVETAHAEEHTDSGTLIANQLRHCQEADQRLFHITKNLLETIGVEDREAFQHLDEVLDLCVAEDRTSKTTRLIAKDMRSVIADFNADTAMILLNKKEKATLGLSSFLEHAKSGSQDRIVTAPFNEVKGLREFAESMVKNRDQETSQDIALEWLRAISPSYTETRWSEAMKMTVVQMLNSVDPFLYEMMRLELEKPSVSPKRLAGFELIIPMLLELRIEIYERVTNQSSAEDYATRMDAKYRLDRWLDMASLFVSLLDRPATESVCVRLMWASIMASSLSDDPVREHILLLWTSLRDFLTKEDVKPIHLPNNLIMPTISSAAADREISKLTTMDFFLSLFQEGMEDPVHVIETLEPVLNPSSVYVMDPVTVSVPVHGRDESAPSPGASEASTEIEIEIEDEQEKEKEKEKSRAVSDCANQGMRDLWNFLRSSSTELRLFLWSRLGDAYEAIGYSTKRFSCHLRSIEIVVSDLEGDKYASLLDESRRLLFMRTLKSLDELLIQSLTLALNDTSAFDIIDNDHLESSASALAKISCLLHVGVLCEDEVRIGVTTAPSSNSTFQSLINKLREMQVRAWCLQYVTFKASLPLQKSLAPDKDLADFLAAIHQVIGLRKGCKVSNKVLLKLMRMELLKNKNKNIENWEDHLGQVVYDLYGLKIGVGLTDFQDHGCPPEKLEKRQTMQLVEKVMILANRMPMKDLLKSDLKNTIEHMQQTIGQPVSTPQMIHNLRNFSEQLKKPIHPLRLYQALHGGVSVDAVTVKTPEAILAKHGWFFLLGMIALSKFKAVDLNRRQTPGATDDLRIGATFLRLQLQFTADRWEAWFRLAECFDYELDEAVLWTADKMNKDRPELVKFQRNAIHCYTLALSHSRHQEMSANDGDPLHDLYHKFGMRLYASSREPFAMEPFQHADYERFFIERVGCGTFKRILHEEMSEYKVWKFAAKLFRMAMERDPSNWKNPYMLAKCYWKMHQTPEEKLQKTDKKSRITTQTLLDSLQQAIGVAFHARKSRHSDPILEPHYKLVSILHKLVTKGQMTADKAAALLSEQPFGVGVPTEAAADLDDTAASFSEPKAWVDCVVRNLSRLKEKDKSNWQHRIVARHAQIVFDEDNDSDSARAADDLKADAKAAFGILRENMFTKTMVMNVWKCDAERPGRHHVFTEQYVRFMTRILVMVSDRANLEQLLRRLRKKGADFYHFIDLWQSCCNAYLKLLRQEHNVPPLADETFKSMSTDDFETISERITEWAAGDEAETPAFLCMKEAIELKKLNANLIKVAVIDDLINDSYCKIYMDVASTLSGMESVLPQTPTLEAIKNPVHETEPHQKGHNEVQEEAGDVQDPLEEKPHAVDTTSSQPTAPPSSVLNPTVSSTQDNNNPAGSATPLDADKSETAPKIRKTGVRRADILRKAEQAVVRSMEMPKQLAHGGGRSRVGSLSSNKRGSRTPVAGGSDADSDDGGPERQVRREAGEDVEDGDAEDTQIHEDGGDEGGGEVEHDGDGDGLEDSKLEDRTELESEAGSIHDDADDESDLSDVPEGYDDDVPPGLLFPELLLGRALPSADETSGVDADSESEGDDPDEPDEDEERRVAAAGDDEVLMQRMTEDGDHNGAAEDDRRSDGDGDGDTEMRDAELTFSAEDTIEIGQ